MKVARTSPDEVPPVGPYSQVARVELGDAALLFVSGQVAVDEKGEIVGAGDITAQATRVFENLKAVLASQGATLEDVLKLTTFLRDMGHRAALGEVRKRYFLGDPPASTAVEVSRLARDEWLIEVEAIAAVPAARSAG
ncbi:MAG TPA: RidA family protein [Candidatus Limnocylindria bacterium]|nr:RidA family protein [Candidatus Limnocylindria bacterium]